MRPDFGMLTVSSNSHRFGRYLWRDCVCLCGAEKRIRQDHVFSGRTKSCGCLKNVSRPHPIGCRCNAHKASPNRSHGMSNTPTYGTWTAMVQRCTNPNRRNWRWYGALGVKICERWNMFENFLADMGTRPMGKTLDRLNPEGNYEPSNCRWADQKTQMNNLRRKANV